MHHEPRIYSVECKDMFRFVPHERPELVFAWNLAVELAAYLSVLLQQFLQLCDVLVLVPACLVADRDEIGL